MITRLSSILILLTFLVGCKKEATISEGKWRGEIALSEGSVNMPFNMEVEGKAPNQKIYLINGEERILLDEIKRSEDSVSIPMHIFDAEIVAKVEEAKLTGSFIRPNIYTLPFKATMSDQRFTDKLEKPAGNISGKWAVNFIKPDGKKNFAIGLFTQKGNNLTGTFMTKTGDYRFLDGIVTGNKLKLSTFDGSHAYLFEAEIEGDSLKNGHFWAGKTGHYQWEAKKDETVELPDANSLTFLKEGYETISFEFPNLEGKQVSLTDEKFKDKVVIVQILGSWCPNCMDETAFYAPFYKEYKDKGVEIVGLAYETTDEFSEAQRKLKRMQKRFDIQYEMLFAGRPGGAAKSLPMLNHVMSFPTSIVIDKTGKVRQIHTGFSGPGTGKYYEEFVHEFTALIDKLIAE